MRTLSLADSGNFVIVFLTIAWVIYSIYKKFKKGRVPVSNGQDEQKEEDTEEPVTSWIEKAILGEEFSEKKERPVPMTFAEEIQSYRKAAATNPEPFLSAEMQLYRGGEYADQVTIQIEEPKGNPDNESPADETHTLNVDLKTAVIYSAILDRPKY